MYVFTVYINDVFIVYLIFGQNYNKVFIECQKNRYKIIKLSNFVHNTLQIASVYGGCMC